MIRRWGLVILMSAFLFITGCSAEDEELSDYVDKVQEALNGGLDVDESTDEFGQLLADDEPEEAVKVLKEKVIPGYEALIAEYEALDLKGEDAIATNNIVIRLFSNDLDTQRVLSEIFEEILAKADENQVDEINIEAQVDALSEINKEAVAAAEAIHDQVIYLTDTYDFLELEAGFDGAFEDLDAKGFDEDNELLILMFLEMVVDKRLSDTIEGDLDEEGSEDANQEVETERNESSKDSVLVDEEILVDRGNPNVALDATVTIEDNLFTLIGLSNLIEGSTVYLDSYHYGSDNPYLKEELVVDEDGSFELTFEIDPADLTGDPLTLRLSYQPDKEAAEAQEIYGEEGEKLEGPFKHKFTSTKRTRHGAFTYAQMEFKEGESQEFGTWNWDEPSDYGDLTIWIEESAIEIKDEYYDITMKSNLHELTQIKADIEVSGYDIAGYTSRTKVMPDGTFRFQIPRPDLNGEEVIVIIEAESDAAIETEELYGEYGENFEGSLTEETDRGQKIVYKILLGETS